MTGMNSSTNPHTIRPCWNKNEIQIEKAVDGEEALEKVQAGNPDLIILDNVMPKLYRMGSHADAQA